MILQEEFKQSGYKDLLSEENTKIYKINLEDLFDLNDMPLELISIYISEKGDELFFIIDGDKME